MAASIDRTDLRDGGEWTHIHTARGCTFGMAESGENDARQSARPVVSLLVALFTGAGITLQQLSTGEPASTGRWVMLIAGSAIGGLGGLFAAGLFDSLLAGSGNLLEIARRWLRPRVLFAVGGLCVFALALGYAVPPVVDWVDRWWHGCDQPAVVRVLTSAEQLGAAQQLA